MGSVGMCVWAGPGQAGWHGHSDRAIGFDLNCFSFFDWKIFSFSSSFSFILFSLIPFTPCSLLFSPFFHSFTFFVSCGPTVVELTLPFLAHKPDANRHLHRRSLFRLWLNTLGVCSRDRRRCIFSWLGLCDSWLMLMCKRCSRNALRMRVPLLHLTSLTACRTRRR